MSVPARRVALGAAVGAALFHLYAAGVEPFTALIQRPVHLALMAVMGFLVVGGRASVARGGPDGGPPDQGGAGPGPGAGVPTDASWWSWVLAGLTVLVCV
ncbi:MAG TPA: hypothetical protein VJ997_14270, partial [Longimicrobiales bacterium]|nr:hypothetical protein [Longimicrobiales bacterium]